MSVQVVDKKSFWKSKVLWINVLMILGMVFTDASQVLGAEGSITLLSVVNIVLRVVTKAPLKL